MKLILVMAAVFFSPLAYSAINSKLSCKVFINAMPEADLEIHITGTTPTQESKTLTAKTGKFRAELSWEGYYEGIPRNPEMRIQYLTMDQEKIILEAYKNFDLQKYEKQESKKKCNLLASENDDNIGIRTAEEVVYLSCDYLKITSTDCDR